MVYKLASVDLVSMRRPRSVKFKDHENRNTSQHSTSAQRKSGRESPENASSFTVAVEANGRIDLTPVKPIDGVMQSRRRIDI